MRTKNDVDDLLEFIGNETEYLSTGPQTIDEIQYAADNLGLTNSKFLKGKSFEEQKLSAQVRGAQQLLVNNVDQLAGLGERAKTEGMTPSLYATIQEKLAIVRAVYAKFDENTSELGRALRVLREVAESRKSTEASLRFMDENQGLDVLSDPEATQRLIDNLISVRETDGDEAAARVIRNATKLRAEDYVGSVIFNFMLSSPKTWLLNAVGSPMNFATDLVVDSAAGVADPVLRIREIVSRMTGAIEALKQYRTWKNIYDTAVTGESRAVGLEGKTGGRGVAFHGALSPIEGPRRIMGTIDEFWSNMFYMSNLYGEASKAATKEGRALGTSSDTWYRNKYQELIDTPTQEMMDAARATTNRQLFRDSPSTVGQELVDAVTPRYEDEVLITMVTDPNTGKLVPRSKVTKPKTSGAARVGKFAGRVIVPFIPTLDSIARTIIRNSGPGALASGEIRRQLMTPGVERQSALARIAVSTAAMGMWAYMANEGLITGAETGNWRERTAESGVRPPYSIKIGDTWVSYRGFDPIAGQIAGVATAVDNAKRSGEPTTASFIADTASGMAQSLMESSYAESLMNFFKMTSEAAQYIEEGETPGTALKNFVAGQGANILTPAGVRWANQSFVDPAARDTSSDGSVTGRTIDRAKAGWPGLSTDLPQKYDVFGREVLNPRQWREEETDPAVLEINRLERLDNKIVMGPPDKTIYKGSPNQKKLNSEEFQQYQQLSGFWALEDIKAEMSSPEWQDKSDEDKIKTIKGILRDARKDARNDLFPKEDNTDETEEEDN